MVKMDPRNLVSDKVAVYKNITMLYEEASVVISAIRQYETLMSDAKKFAEEILNFKQEFISSSQIYASITPLTN
jgi:hypothetical protein